VLVALGMGQLPVAALAKSKEEVFIPGISSPLDIDPDSPGGRMLRHLRDEAHRFALNYHRRLRARALTSSTLDNLPGVGPARKKALIRHFGTAAKVGGASPEQLAGVPGIGPALARQIHLALQNLSHETEDAETDII